MPNLGIPPVWFLGVAFTPLELDTVVRTVTARSAALPFVYICTPNAQHVVIYHREAAALRSAHDSAWMRTCDSRVLSILARWLFGKQLPVATGSDLAARLFETVVKPDDPITIIGVSNDDVVRLCQRYGLRRVAHHEPPMGFIDQPQAVSACVRFVQNHPARFVFICCGFPRSELLALAIEKTGGATGIALCVGSAILFLTGSVRRAPRLWQYLGVEWLYRIWQEPHRLLRRFWHQQLPVLGLVLRARLRPTLHGPPSEPMDRVGHRDP